MIEVRMIDDHPRLFCTERKEFQFHGNPMVHAVLAETVGAIVHLEPGTVVDWWVSAGITVEENVVIENSYLQADTGVIRSHTVVIGSVIIAAEIGLESRLEAHGIPGAGLTGIRRCSLYADENVHILQSNLSFVQSGDSGALLVMESQVEHCRLMGHVSIIRSAVKDLFMERKSPYQLGERTDADYTIMAETMKTAGIQHILLNVVKSTVSSLSVQPRGVATLIQHSEVKNTSINSNICMFGSKLISSQITNGDLIHLINCHIENARASSEMDHTTLVDCTAIADENDEDHFWNFTVCTGDVKGSVM